jgi:tetratricopeptide (TPR) repeat protein
MNQLRLLLVAAGFVVIAACAPGEKPSPPPKAAGRSADLYSLDSWPLDSSPWIQKQEKIAADTLSANSSDVLVVPFQVDGDSVDAVERSLMTRAVVERVRARGDRSVADPTLVERALGTSVRTVSDTAAFRLANLVHATTVVLGYVGHDNSGKFNLRVESVAVEPDSPVARSRRVVLEMRGVAFNDTQPPYFSLRPRLDDLVDKIVGARALPKGAGVTISAPSVMPASLAEIETLGDRGPVQSAYLLQFLGVLHPRDFQDRARDGLFERSLLVLEGAADTAESRALRARAWGYLNRRPLGLSALEASSEEEKGVRAFLDADLEKLTAAVPKMTSPLAKVMATVERERLRMNYGGEFDPKVAKELAVEYPYWAPLIVPALASAGPWTGHSSAPIAAALDAYWPSPKYGLATALRASELLANDLSDHEIAELAYKHIEEASASLDQEWPRDAKVRRADVVDLLREMLVGVVVGEVDHVLVNLALPERALTEVLSYAPLFSGHPDFEIARGRTELAVAAIRREPESTNLKNAGYEHLRNGAIWSQGQTAAHQSIRMARSQIFAISGAFGLTDAESRFFDTDWPNRPGWYWQVGTSEERDQRLRHCVDYTIKDLSCLTAYYEMLVTGGHREAAAALFEANEYRFVGHPERTDFLVRARLQAGDTAAANDLLSRAIASGTIEWAPYLRTGYTLAAQGKPKEALAVFLKYPGFKNPVGMDSVDLSNRAYDVGSILYWAGSYEAARPLYEFAAGLDTGSNASITSRSRLALLDRDYKSALAATAERASRYGSPYALRDLMTLEAALGDRATAWAVFNSMETHLREPDFWVGALAVQRMEGASPDTIVAWATQGSRTAPRTSYDTLAMRHIFMSQVIDRDVSGALAETLRRLDPGPPTFRDQHNVEMRNPRLVGRDSRLTFAALGLAALAEKDYERAWDAFAQGSALYPLDEFLPYYAWAGVHLGRADLVERYFRPREMAKETGVARSDPTSGEFFDELLSRAVFEDARGNVDAALDYLVRANADVQQTEARALFTRYEIADIAELLYDGRNDPRYRDFVVDLARRNTVIDPMSSWPYAFLAKYSDDVGERKSALARALYLDPQSRRALSAKPEEIGGARKLLSTGNPFAVAVKTL